MSKAGKIDVGSMMSFKNRGREKYSMKNIKDPILPQDKIVKIDLDELVSSPEEWNFYPPLENDEFEKLVFSILEHGLLHPIVVRKVEDKNIVLSGHNRVRAYRAIAEDIENIENGFDGKYIEVLEKNIKIADFKQIMAVIKEDISDSDAREIIIDANYVQRQLSPKLITKSVVEKYKIIKEKRKNSDDDFYKSHKTRDIVASEFKLSGRHIDRYKRLEKLNTNLLELFYTGKISLELASKLAGLKSNVQQHLFEKYENTLTKYPSKISQEIKPSLTIKDIDNIFNELLISVDQVKISICENGKTKNFVVENPELIQKIKRLLRENR